eukprot:scaffold145643_cov26-Tisochrysis_lutea.AAC.2
MKKSESELRKHTKVKKAVETPGNTTHLAHIHIHIHIRCPLGRSFTRRRRWPNVQWAPRNRGWRMADG